MSYFLQHEPKRLAGVETDSPKVNPQGDQTERRAGHQPSQGIGGLHGGVRDTVSLLLTSKSRASK
jgi:hypothetical protein